MTGPADDRPRLALLSSYEPIDLADARFARDVVALWRLGPRAVAELLAEISGEFLIRVSVEKKVERFARRLTPELLRAAGADQMPPIINSGEIGRIIIGRGARR
jgi:hypothetical protein